MIFKGATGMASSNRRKSGIVCILHLKYSSYFITFRKNPVKVYFERNHIVLTTDLNKIEEWQPGDIVVFGTRHIGIISDKRNKKGIPYLSHNGGQPIREEDILELYNQYEPITGHFRLREI